MIAPSILSADFARLGEEVTDAVAAGADWIHVDVMDGRFVPNLTIGPPVVAALRRVTSAPLDVHLMIVEPEKYLEAFAEAGADVITIHAEATAHLHRALSHIRSLGCRAGVSLNPSTSEHALDYVLPLCDVVLLMSVNPGFGGQSFIEGVLPKATAISAAAAARGLELVVEIDGGISPKTVRAAAAAGCSVFVAGNAIFGAGGGRDGYAKAIEAIRGEAAIGAGARA